MVWSLSKDDDGLDSVLPLADGGIAPGSPKATATARSIVSDATPLGASPTVVVDPISQVPEGFGTRPAGKRVVEPTLVLKGRKLDQLRAEVARYRTVHQRKKQRALLVWAGAGALALCLGWAVGTAFRPHESAGERAEVSGVRDQPELDPNQLGSSNQPGSSQTGSGQTGRTAPSEQPPTIDLTDLPAEDEPASGRGKSAEPPEAFTLDDLPVD